MVAQLFLPSKIFTFIGIGGLLAIATTLDAIYYACYSPKIYWHVKG
jgi:hypothetical protein